MPDARNGHEADTRLGLIFGGSAYLLWGIFPLYWPLLKPAGTIEILAQRMVWSLVVVLLLLRFTGGFGGFAAVLRNRRSRWFLVVGAMFVTVNWGTYIYGVNSAHVVETSLGYFINPLFTILLGVFMLGERLRRAQWAAVGLGGLAVVVIAVDYGRPPWIALILAATFALYGLCKKQADVAAVESLAVETSVMVVPALIALLVIGLRGDLVFGHHGAGNALLLATSGLVTAVPLLLFAGGMRRLPLSAIGLLQYLAPVLQFAVGVGIRHEATPPAELAGFVLVWIALVILTVDGLRGQRGAKDVDPAEAAASVAA